MILCRYVNEIIRQDNAQFGPNTSKRQLLASNRTGCLTRKCFLWILSVPCRERAYPLYLRLFSDAHQLQYPSYDIGFHNALRNKIKSLFFLNLHRGLSAARDVLVRFQLHQPNLCSRFSSFSLVSF